ncbi:class I SAM-dependent methyltransferase [Piscinibacter koreensis]|uniref:S-adenosyl-L-methionine-dependent methyltransferase n=1 Tax=Piscinibacter koreensis TaxID=2742824 RepID=A0A7Y6TUZ1_9BURK|nr:SAM-dependent methyltransferase [Schlegelella koreensis]NUZ04386.1 class I SAM-dependent methyltransferase [Schlegelella koreensis]
MTSPIRSISDTARWVAIYRAWESARPDRLFDDPYASRMAGARGDAIVQSLPHGESMAWAIVVRTAVFDDMIVRAVADGAGTVLNLGAGLCTRAFRLDLPPTLDWIDVDLPDIVDWRRHCLGEARPACRHEHRAVDLTDAAARQRLLADATDRGKPVLVVSEGLLVYMAPEHVAALARELHADPRVTAWVTDLVTPMLVNTFGTLWRAHLDSARAPFRFAPADPPAFFAPLGWHEGECRSMWDESQRLSRAVPIGWWWDLFGRFLLPDVYARLRRMATIVRLERQPPTGGAAWAASPSSAPCSRNCMRCSKPCPTSPRCAAPDASSGPAT